MVKWFAPNHRAIWCVLRDEMTQNVAWFGANRFIVCCLLTCAPCWLVESFDSQQLINSNEGTCASSYSTTLFPKFYTRKQVSLISNYACLTLSIASWNLAIPLSLSFVLWHTAKSFLCKCVRKLIEKYCLMLAFWLFLLYICHAISFVLCPTIGHDAMQNLCNNPF